MTDPSADPHPRTLLVIGYGNELRSDDGVGAKVAHALEQMNVPGILAIACHQLTPELAEPVARAARVVFVDASVDPAARLELRELQPAGSTRVMAHAAGPRGLLALARDLFGHYPAAWWLTIPVESTGFGEELSPLARQGMEWAIRRIRALAA